MLNTIYVEHSTEQLQLGQSMDMCRFAMDLSTSSSTVDVVAAYLAEEMADLMYNVVLKRNCES